MANYMEIAHARVNRAWEHIEQFILEADSFLETNPCRVIPKINAEGTSYLVRYIFKVNRQPPINLRFLIGDAIHNLRSTLDGVIWNLGRISGELPRSKLAFPVRLDRDKFRQNDLPKLKRLPPNAQILIENVQPYNRTDAPETHPLYILNELWNDDKHEAPIVVAGVYTSIGIGAKPGGIIRIIHGGTGGGATDDGAEIFRMLVANKQSVDNLKSEFTIDVAFDKVGPARGAIARKLLLDLHDFIRVEVVDKFTPFFPI